MYSREIDDRVLTFAASGWTYNNTFILYDHQTESLWYPFTEDELVCIAGEYADRHLPRLNSFKVRWNDWVKDYPRSKMLACNYNRATGCEDK